MAFKHLSVADLKVMLAEQAPVLLDIRDEASFAAGHIDGSEPLNDQSVQALIQKTEKTAAVVVICYHGHSSQNAADFLFDQGFSEVYSLAGGYTAWAAATTD